MEDSVQFFNEETDFLPEKEVQLKTWIQATAEEFDKEILSINYIFCSDEYLLTLNRQYLDHDYFTDILTFPYPTPVPNQLHSDIYISVDRVRENAQSFESSFENELHRVMVHGLLHLIGFDDHGDDKVKEMRSQEDAALAKIDF